MTHDEEVSTIGRLIELEREEGDLSETLSGLRDETYESSPGHLKRPVKPQEPKLDQPTAPTRGTAERKYPSAESKSRFGTGCLMLVILWLSSAVVSVRWSARHGSLDGFGYFVFGVIWIAIMVFAYLMHKWLKARDIERIARSQKFMDEITELDRKYDEQQRELDARYEEELREYEQAKRDAPARYDAARKEYTKKLARYQLALMEYDDAKAQWEALQSQEVAACQEELGKTRAELQNLYSTSMLVPQQFRNLEALGAIYETVSTSGFSVEAAINLYQQDRQRELDERRRQLEQQRLWEMQAANEEAARQNDLLEEQNDIARKTRRDMDIANVVAIAQRREQRKQDQRNADREDRQRNDLMKDEYFRRLHNGEDTGHLPIDWRK